MTLDGKILRGLFEHERLKQTIIRTSRGNVHNLPQLKQVINIVKTVLLKYSIFYWNRYMVTLLKYIETKGLISFMNNYQ